MTLSGLGTPQVGPEYRYGYNGVELQADFDLNWWDTYYRGLDPALGRWTGVDPKADARENPYMAMAGDPIRYSDALGDTTYIYSTNGSFLNVSNDELPNQVHYVSEKNYKNYESILAAGFDQNIASLALRTESVAFMGSNTAKELKVFYGESSGVEGMREFGGLLYLGENSKELKVWSCETCKISDKTQIDLVKANKEDFNNSGQRREFGTWHTHPPFPDKKTMGGFGSVRFIQDAPSGAGGDFEAGNSLAFTWMENISYSPNVIAWKGGLVLYQSAGNYIIRADYGAVRKKYVQRYSDKIVKKLTYDWFSK